MKTIDRTRYRGRLLLLCGLMLFLMTPQVVQAQEELPEPTLPDISLTRVTKNGTVIEEGAPPAIRRKRTPLPQDTKAATVRSPKQPWAQDVDVPALAVETPDALNVPLAAAPEADSKGVAGKTAPLTTTAPAAAAPDEPDTFVLGMEGLRPETFKEGTVDVIAEALHADMMEAPTLAIASQPVAAKLIQSGQELATLSDDINLPESFALEANYPNPFNPETTIRFALPEAAQVRIRVFDLLGREVALLVDGSLTAGRHEVTFDGRSLASGIYIYRMVAGSFEQHRTMLLMK